MERCNATVTDRIILPNSSQKYLLMLEPTWESRNKLLKSWIHSHTKQSTSIAHQLKQFLSNYDLMLGIATVANTDVSSAEYSQLGVIASLAEVVVKFPPASFNAPMHTLSNERDYYDKSDVVLGVLSLSVHSAVSASACVVHSCIWYASENA